MQEIKKLISKMQIKKVMCIHSDIDKLHGISDILYRYGIKTLPKKVEAALKIVKNFEYAVIDECCKRADDEHG